MYTNFPIFEDDNSIQLVGSWEGYYGGIYQTTQGWIYEEHYGIYHLTQPGFYVLETGYKREYNWDPNLQQVTGLYRAQEYPTTLGLWGTSLDPFSTNQTGFNQYTHQKRFCFRS